MTDILNISNLFTSLLFLVLVYINIKLYRKKKMILLVFVIMEISVFAESQLINDVSVIFLCIIGGLILVETKIKFGDDDDLVEMAMEGTTTTMMVLVETVMEDIINLFITTMINT